MNSRDGKCFDSGKAIAIIFIYNNLQLMACWSVPVLFAINNISLTQRQQVLHEAVEAARQDK